jgi:amino acid adenylation domain-containing protein
MIKELYTKLKHLNINIEISDGKLDVSAPKGAVTTEILNEIKANKEELIQFVEYYKNKKKTHIPLPIADVTDGYKLSSSQKRLWVLNQVEEQNSLYNIPALYRFKGLVDKKFLEKSFTELIKRHEILRTVFKEDATGEPRQYIKNENEVIFKIEHYDLRSQNNAAASSELVNTFLQKPFDLKESPLLRAQLIQSDDQDYIFCFVIHHIISDGWSMTVLIQELIKFYNGFITEAPLKMDPLRIQYKDYANWQQTQLIGQKLHECEKFWLEQYSGDIPISEMPTSFPRPAIKTYNGNLSKKITGKQALEKLKEYSLKNEGTLFMGIISCINILLYKYTGESNIIIGTPVSGRNHDELQDQIGFYINTLPLYYRFNKEDSYHDFFNKVRKVTIDSYTYQDYPFDELVSKLNISRQANRHPLFDIMVVLQDNFDSENITVNGLNGIEINDYDEAGHSLSKFDITFNFSERPDGLHMLIEYNTDLYSRDFIENLSGHFEQVILSVTNNADEPLSSIAYLKKEEEQYLLGMHDRRDVGYDVGSSIVKEFENAVANNGNKTALHYEGEEITYSELNSLSNQLGRYLKDHYGIKGDDLVGVKLDRGIDQVTALLGVLKSGGAYVPMEVDYPEDRLNYIIKDSGCKVVIDAMELLRFRDEQKRYSSANLAEKPGARDLAYIIYTSGTTGHPKGVMIEHRHVIRLLKTKENLFDFSKEDVWTMFHSYCFDFSVWEMYGALLNGGKLILVPGLVARDPVRYLNLLSSQKVSVLNQTPSAFYNLIGQEKEQEALDLNLRYVIFGGEALSPGRLKSWVDRYPATRLINMYGITETTVHVTYKEIGEKEIDENISSIGHPIPTLSCYVFDQDRKLVAPGISGELYVGGEGLARGYLNKTDLTSERFVENPYRKTERLYRSGDKVRLLSNGEMEYLGRMDEQVKIRGYRIELAEIESVLLKHEKIKSCVVIARTDSKGEKNLVAYVVGSQEVTASELRLWMSSHLPGYMLPSYFVGLDHLPLTTNGKIDKRSLPDPESTGLSTGTQYVPPVTDIQVALVKIWSEVLDLSFEKIGIRDNFFELGGHSLKVAKLLWPMYERLGIKIELSLIFENPTIEQLTDALEIILGSHKDGNHPGNREEELVV